MDGRAWLMVIFRPFGITQLLATQRFPHPPNPGTDRKGREFYIFRHFRSGRPELFLALAGRRLVRAW